MTEVATEMLQSTERKMVETSLKEREGMKIKKIK